MLLVWGGFSSVAFGKRCEKRFQSISSPLSTQLCSSSAKTLHVLTIPLATQATTKFPCFSICTGHPILSDWRKWQRWAGGRPRWSSNRGHCHTQGCSWCKKRCCVRFSSSCSVHHSFRYKLFCLLREIQKIADDNITSQWQILEILFGLRTNWHLSFCLLL